jgi:asparagine synthase (glutamine-hydrolysing)
VSDGDQHRFLDSVGTFVAADGNSHERFFDASIATRAPAKLDVVSVASMLCFQYVVDRRSLLSSISRRSWLTVVTDNDELDPALVATYGRRLTSPHTAASELLSLFRAELESAFAGAGRVTVLLSGGLDSRLAAAVLAGLSSEGKVTDDVRAITWGLPDSRDRHFGRRVARILGMKWQPIELGPENLVANIETAATELGALLSPVHLHATAAVSALDWDRADRILVSTLGNGVGRGTYLWRHISYVRRIEPVDWLALMRPDVGEQACAELVSDLVAFREHLRPCSSIARHECEMLAHYICGQLLPVYRLLGRTAAPVHQSLSDPSTYRFLWSLSPALRTSALYRTALRMCRPELADVPYAMSNRPLRHLARAEPNGLSPFVHQYPHWIAHDLAGVLDEALASEWWDATGTFDGVAIGRAWRSIRHHPDPHPHTAYLLLWLCALRRLMEYGSADNRRAGPAVERTGPAVRAQLRPGPPWGFAGRPADGRWRRAASLPGQAMHIAACQLGVTSTRRSARSSGPVVRRHLSCGSGFPGSTFWSRS